MCLVAAMPAAVARSARRATGVARPARRVARTAARVARHGGTFESVFRTHDHGFGTRLVWSEVEEVWFLIFFLSFF